MMESGDNSINATDTDLHIPLTSNQQTSSPQQKPPNFNYASANPISFLFFWWSRISISLSNTGRLKIEDVCYLTQSQSTEYNYLPFQALFNKTLQKGTSKRPLLSTLFHTHLCSFLLLIIFNCLEISLQLISIYFFGNIIRNFSEQSHPTYFTLYQNIIGMITSKVLSTLNCNHIRFFEVLLGERITNQVNAMLYNKTLRSAISCGDKSKTEAEKINLIDVDAERVGFLFFIGPKLLTAPIEIASSFAMLFNLFGVNFIYGFSCLCVVLIIVLILQVMILRNQKKLLKKKDEVMGVQTHVFMILKMLKMYGWDDKSIDEINRKKDNELKYLRRNLNIFLGRNLLNSNLSLIILIGTLARYAYGDEVVNIASLFTAIQLITQLTRPLTAIPMFLTGFFSNLLSIERIQEFLLTKEHDYESREDATMGNGNIAVMFEQCSFGIKIKEETKVKDKTEDEDKDDSEEGIELKMVNSIIRPSTQVEIEQKQMIFLNDINCFITKGEFVAVIGQTGSGKTCFLNAIMNNYDILPTSGSEPKAIINGKLSYAPQTPWIINDTIQSNILFFNPLQEAKYTKIINACQLTYDLKHFTNGDLTEISSAGTTLSGGQKARLSLARAVYQEADIYLLDDSLANVDSKVANLIFKEILCNFLKNKTRIFVTNTIKHLEHVDRIIFLEKGRVKWMGNYKEFKQTYEEEFTQLSTEEAKEKEKTEKTLRRQSTNLDDNKSESFKLNGVTLLKEGKLINAEEINKGKIPISLYVKYIKLQGGFILVSVIVILSFITQVLKLQKDIHVTTWFQRSKDVTTPNDAVSKKENIQSFITYAQISLGGILLQFIIDFLKSRATIRTLRTLYQSMIYKLIKAPINLFHDVVPIGRILNRLTKDLGRVHDSFFTVTRLIEANLGLIISIYVCYIYNPYSLLVSPFILLVGIIITRYYISAGRNLDRLHRISFSPVLNFLSESLHGIETIRVSSNEGNMRRKFYEKLDNHYAVHIFDEGAEKWYTVFLDLMSHGFYSLIILFVLYFKQNFTAQAIGLILQYSASFSRQLIASLESMTMIEKGMVSLERCDAYTLIPTEKNVNLKDSKVKTGDEWPRQGVIEFKNYSTRYRPNTNIVLHDINLQIKHGEKIGIVGRTGSGKSTLSLALCRIIEAETGGIEIDGVDLSKVNLELLRKRICLVPQDPFVLEGSLRYNLDPLHQCTDKEINELLDQLSLFMQVSPKARLAMKIKENGVNFSIGQKQLIGFARAILKRSKVIVLDEATSNIDTQTETMIKGNLKSYFKESTVIIIAHRIQMVNDCDRIIVIDNGRIKEIGTYDTLLQNKKSLFYSLYAESNTNQ